MRWRISGSPERTSQKKEDASEDEIAECLARSIGYVESGDISAARIEYERAYRILPSIDKNKQFRLAPDMRALYEALYLQDHKNAIYTSIKGSKENLNKLYQEIADVYKKTRDAYYDFLLQEREFNVLIEEMKKHKKTIESTKQELSEELKQVKTYSERLILEKMKFINEREGYEDVLMNVQKEFNKLEKDLGIADIKSQVGSFAPGASGASGTSKEMVTQLMSQLSQLLEKGDKAAALNSYESLREQYKSLSQQDKQELYQRLMQLQDKF